MRISIIRVRTSIRRRIHHIFLPPIFEHKLSVYSLQSCTQLFSINPLKVPFFTSFGCGRANERHTQRCGGNVVNDLLSTSTIHECTTHTNVYNTQNEKEWCTAHLNGTGAFGIFLCSVCVVRQCKMYILPSGGKLHLKYNLQIQHNQRCLILVESLCATLRYNVQRNTHSSVLVTTEFRFCRTK